MILEGSTRGRFLWPPWNPFPSRQARLDAVSSRRPLPFLGLHHTTEPSRGINLARPARQHKSGKEAGTAQLGQHPHICRPHSLTSPFTPTVYSFSHSLVLDCQVCHSFISFFSGINRSQRGIPRPRDFRIPPYTSLSLPSLSFQELRRFRTLAMAGGKWRNRLRRVRDRLVGRDTPIPPPEAQSMPPPPLPSAVVSPPAVSPTAVRTKPPVVQLGPSQPTYYFPTSERDDGPARRREPDFIPIGVVVPNSTAPPQAKGAYRAKAPPGGLGTLPTPYLNPPTPYHRQQQQRLYQPMPLQQRQPQQQYPQQPPHPRTHIPLSRLATNNAQAAGFASSSRTPLSPGGYASPNASISGGSGGSPGSSTGGSPGPSRYRQHHGQHQR